MKAFRKFYGLNTEAAGRVFGISGRTIEGIEQGRRDGDRVLELAIKNIKAEDIMTYAHLETTNMSNQ